MNKTKEANISRETILTINKGALDKVCKLSPGESFTFKSKGNKLTIIISK